jgi:hypothetical protein
MTKLWRAIEESPLLMDVKDVWRERLGKDFEPLSRFLEATHIVATRLPGRTPWSSFKVVENDDGFMAFCESTCESKEVLRADVICHQLNSRQLAAELNAALNLGRKPEWLDNSRRVWFLGNLSLELQSRPVYMTLHIASDLITEALHAAAAHARSTFLLLDLNSKRRDQKFDASAKIVDCKPVELEQLFNVTSDGCLLAKSKSRELIASILGVTLESRLSGFVARIAAGLTTTSLKISSSDWKLGHRSVVMTTATSTWLPPHTVSSDHGLQRFRLPASLPSHENRGNPDDSRYHYSQDCRVGVGRPQHA